MSNADDRRFFFIHVMKTAGGTFSWEIRANFPPTELYPDPRKKGDDRNKFEASTSIDYLLSLPAERRDRIRAYMGHFPFAATQLVNADLTTLTILREPVERIVSHLKHRAERVPAYRDQTLEQIYSEPAFFNGSLHNHQAKLFAMTTQDPLQSYLDAIEVDADRLERAKSNLAKVDVVGLTEDYEGFCREVERQFGWTTGNAKDVHVSEGDHEIPDALVERIRSDNQADIEFYEYAKSLIAERAAGSGVSES